jgi:hypothetical protein
MRTSSTLAVSALAAFAAIPATALAADRHVSPVGAGATCSQASPCALGYALGAGSAPGDTILLAAGTYPAGAGFTFTKQLTLRAADLAGARPVLSGAQNAVTLSATGAAAGSVVEHLDVRATNGGLSATALRADVPVTVRDTHARGATQAIALFGGGSTLEDFTGTRTAPGAIVPAVRVDGPDVTVRRLTATTPAADGAGAVMLGMGPADTAEDLVVTGGSGVTVAGGTLRRARIESATGIGLAVGPDVLVTDSTVLAKGGDAVFASFGSSRLRHVTAVSTAPGGHGLRAPANPNTSTAHEIVATNVIARGPAADVRADPSRGSASSRTSAPTGASSSRTPLSSRPSEARW